MLLLQLSAAQGPAECCLALAKALARLEQETAAAGVELAIIEREPGEQPGTWRSLLLGLSASVADDRVERLAARWQGTLQWICASPYRPHYPRKNWFFGGALQLPPAPTLESQIRFEAQRASGPGGQHVNKTDSAIRATHLASGISVKVQSERSQHANKRLAVLLIAHKLQAQQDQLHGERRAERRLFHHQVARGQPTRVFRGERFEAVEH
ncbi:MAG: peptide chain release factor H [Pseudomonas sp.]|uniref:peptide chain release factor H n=1 Tax=Pseudomonas sp. TaxID=306 RepID=UPI0033951420